MRPPVDGIREFQVFTSTYDASFGRNAGGQINVITKSGANHFCGLGVRVFPQRRARRPQPFRAGGRAGARLQPAPVRRLARRADRPRTARSSSPTTSSTHLREGITRVTNVPTPAERNGDFSQTLFSRADQFPRRAAVSGRRDPVVLFRARSAAAIAALYPLPESRSRRSRTTCRRRPAATMSIRRTCGSISRSPAASRLTGRYSFSDRRLFEPFAGPGFALVPGFGTDVAAARPERRASRSRTCRLAPRQRCAIRLQPRVDRRVRREHRTSNNASVGLQALSANPRDAGLSVISIAGYSPLGHEYTTRRRARRTRSSCPTPRRCRAGTLVKAGGEWYGVRQSAYRDVQSRGFLTFVNQGYTGNALADLLLGLPVLTGGARLDNPQNLRAHSWSAVRPGRLAADAVADDLRGAALRLHRAAASMRTIARTSTTRRPDSSCRSAPAACRAADTCPIATTSRRAPALRGRSTRSATNVVRGGYGIYYNQGALATSEGLYFNPPYFNLERLLPRRRRTAAHARGSVPGVVSGLHPAVSDRVPARSADAVDGALEREPAAHDRAHAVARVRVRRLARPRPDLGPRHEPGAPPAPIRSTCGRTRCLPTSRSSNRAPRRATTRCRSGIRSGPSTGRRCCCPTRSASRPTMRQGSLRARAIRIFRRTAWIPALSAAVVVRRSSSVHGGA